MDPRSSSPYQADRLAAAKSRHILVVEDNRGDVFLIRESIQAASLEAPLHVVHDGAKAIEFIEETERNPSAPCPAVVILDINLPKKTGRDVLARLRVSRRCADVPVLVVTSSDSERDREDMARLGVSGYFRKSSEYDDFMKLGVLVKSMLEGTAGPS